MDPNEALRVMLAVANKVNELCDQADSLEDFGRALAGVANDLAHAAECTLALHQWISGGGFLPAAWRKGR